MCGHHRREGSTEAGRGRAAGTVVTAAAAERVTDRDRDKVVEQLRLHVGAGRLTIEEFEERLDETLEARTGHELATVLRELPRIRTEAELRGARRSVAVPYLLVTGLLVVIWAVTGFGFPWPLFPIVFWGLPTLGEWSKLRSAGVGAAT